MCKFWQPNLSKQIQESTYKKKRIRYTRVRDGSPGSLSSSNGLVTLQLKGHLAGRYLLECSTNLRQWDLLNTLSNASGSTVYQDRSTAASSRFYRLRGES